MTTIAPTTENLDTPNEVMTLFDTNREPTIMEIYDAENYSDYVVKVALLTPDDFKAGEGSVHYEPHPEHADIQYRFAVLLYVHPAVQQFWIKLRPGAGPDDLEYAQENIRQIRDGRFGQYPWQEHQSRKRPGTVYFGISLGEPVKVSERPRMQFVACTDSACVESFHEVDDEQDMFRLHTAEVIKSSDWQIRVQRQEGVFGPFDPPPSWHLVTDYEHRDWMSVEEAVSFANDLRWAAATAAKLNSLSVAA